MARKDRKNRTCNRCGYTCSTPQMLRAHLNRKNPCCPQVVHPPKIPEPIPQIDPEAGPGPSTQAHREGISQIRDPSDSNKGGAPLQSNNESEITQEEINLLIALGLIEEPEIEECWPELCGTLLADKAKSKKFRSYYRDSGLASITVTPPPGDILFEEAIVGDPDRPHSSLSSL